MIKAVLDKDLETIKTDKSLLLMIQAGGAAWGKAGIWVGQVMAI